MSIKEIESAISELPPAEIAQLADWFYEFQAHVWERQIEHDVQSGRLESLVEQAEREYLSGEYQEL